MGMMVTTGVVLLVSAVVGLAIFDSVTLPMHQTNTVAPDGFVYVADTWLALNQSNIVSDVTEVICGNATNSSWLIWNDFAVDYSVGRVNVTTAGTNAHCNYSWGAASYGSSSTLRTVVQNLPVIMAVSILALAGVALYGMK